MLKHKLATPNCTGVRQLQGGPGSHFKGEKKKIFWFSHFAPNNKISF